jgi:hypothetical protein
MKLAYIVTAYKLPEQLTRLVARLSTESSHFFIHVDKRTDDVTYRRMAAPLSDLANVHFLDRHSCYYGDFGHPRATLKGISAILRRRLPFDYAVLLTGQDYPIKSNAQIDDFFSRRDGQSFMAHFPLPHKDWQGGGMERIRAWHLRLRGKRFRFPPRSLPIVRRRLPGGLRPFGGSSYWCLTAACIEYVYEFVRSSPSYVRFFNYVDVPDEIFFHTIVLNSPLRGTVVNDDLRYLEWRNPAVAGGPAVLGKHDFEKIIRSTKLFARKFDVTRDADVLDMIDARIAED